MKWDNVMLLAASDFFTLRKAYGATRNRDLGKNAEVMRKRGRLHQVQKTQTPTKPDIGFVFLTKLICS